MLIWSRWKKISVLFLMDFSSKTCLMLFSSLTISVCVSSTVLSPHSMNGNTYLLNFYSNGHICMRTKAVKIYIYFFTTLYVRKNEREVKISSWPGFFFLEQCHVSVDTRHCSTDAVQNNAWMQYTFEHIYSTVEGAFVFAVFLFWRFGDWPFQFYFCRFGVLLSTCKDVVTFVIVWIIPYSALL